VRSSSSSSWWEEVDALPEYEDEGGVKDKGGSDTAGAGVLTPVPEVDQGVAPM
jgi:hypothetical protein